METSVEISSCIRGYHIYKRIWTPTIDEQLDAFRATDNTRDLYAVAVKKSADIVGQIPRKISAGCSIGEELLSVL